jgi:tellurite resistance protein TerC
VDFPLWAWVVFGVTLLALLALDLFAHRGDHGQSQKCAVGWTIAWIAAGLGFGGFVWAMWGQDAALDYVAAYLIEKSLSLDNIFVFLIIFGSLRIPHERQHVALSWGVLGALVFRALFVAVGVVALKTIGWITYVFGAILLIAAWRALREDPLHKDGESKLVEWLSRHLPITCQLHQGKFFAVEAGRRCATPLLIAVVALELTDIVFAIDSVPAAFSVTREPFLVYTSNAFAILGLRALYIVMARSLQRMRYLHYGLAAVLAFAGVKMIIDTWVHIPALASIAIIALCIGIPVWLSLAARRAQEPGVAPG